MEKTIKKYNSGLKKPARKTIEKNRRNHMKGLCNKLTSLVPSLSSQPYLSQYFTQKNLYDQSIAYIKQLQKRIEGLKEKRGETSRSLVNNGDRNNPTSNVKDDQPALGCDSVTAEVKEFDGGLRVVLCNRSGRNLTFSEVVRIVEDAGGEVVNGGYTTVCDKVVYTLHAQARVARIGVEITSVYQGLQQLINKTSPTDFLKIL